MDARKIQFLIGIQREIDKLEAKEGNVPKVEKIKSRFYDVVEVEEMVSAGNHEKQDTDEEPHVLMPKAEGDTATISTELQRRKYTPEEVNENQIRLQQLKKEVELSEGPSLPVRKNPQGIKKNINIFSKGIQEKNDALIQQAESSDWNVNDISQYADVLDLMDGMSEEDFLSPEKTEELMKNGVSGSFSKSVDTSGGIPVLYGRKANRSKKKFTHLEQSIIKKYEISFPHKPKDVAAFLVRFRERKNRGLKYLTHRWSDMKRDQPLAYEEVIENAKKEFQECIHLYTIPEMLKSKVREYVITKSWSGKNRLGYPAKGPRFFYSVVNDGNVERIIVDSGWSSDEMVQWVRDNPKSDPNQYDYWKLKLIQPFKQAIEVRDGMFENYLKMNTIAILKNDYDKFNPFYSDSLKEARFFTDVPTLFEGIRKLLSAAKDRAKEPSLNFDYHIPDSTDLYGIRQIKITTDKDPSINSSRVTKDQLIKGGDLGDAYEYFYGLCNWSILCKRGSEYVRINILTDIDGLSEIEFIDQTEVEGFTHILTFYDL